MRIMATYEDDAMSGVFNVDEISQAHVSAGGCLVVMKSGERNQINGATVAMVERAMSHAKEGVTWRIGT